MTLQEIGQTLKEERERQQVSLEEAYSTTKIGLDILRAIEEADLEQLPYHVYTRGFIRNYAEFLGLSGADMVRAFDEAMQEEEGAHSERTGRHAGHQSRGQEGRKGSGAWRSVGLILILVLLLGGLVSYFYLAPPWEKTEKSSDPAVAENATEQREMRESGGSGEASPSDAGNASAGTEESDTESATSGNATEEETEGVSQAEVNRAEVNASGVEQAAQPPRVEDNATEPERSAQAVAETGDNRVPEESASEQLTRHELRVVASEACWINMEMEDGSRDLYLQPGEETTIPFRGTGSVLLGNAGGVTLYLDGEELAVQAESGEVREIELP